MKNRLTEVIKPPDRKGLVEHLTRGRLTNAVSVCLVPARNAAISRICKNSRGNNVAKQMFEHMYDGSATLYTEDVMPEAYSKFGVFDCTLRRQYLGGIRIERVDPEGFEFSLLCAGGKTRVIRWLRGVRSNRILYTALPKIDTRKEDFESAWRNAGRTEPLFVNGYLPNYDRQALLVDGYLSNYDRQALVDGGFDFAQTDFPDSIPALSGDVCFRYWDDLHRPELRCLCGFMVNVRPLFIVDRQSADFLSDLQKVDAGITDEMAEQACLDAESRSPTAENQAPTRYYRVIKLVVSALPEDKILDKVRSNMYGVRFL